jgi:hypothetical protein
LSRAKPANPGAKLTGTTHLFDLIIETPNGMVVALTGLSASGIPIHHEIGDRHQIL